MRSNKPTLARELIVVFGIMSAVSGLLFAVGAIGNSSLEFWYLLWNLALAWIPLLLSLVLVSLLSRRSWTSWLCIVVTMLWLTFLPNTFYMITDFIHLNDVPRYDYIFDTLMFSMIVLTSVGMGVASLATVHRELVQRTTTTNAWRVILAIMFALSFAIYVGRELRWNTWDIVLNPTGMLFDISELILRPWAFPAMFVITASFFVAITTLYYCVWRGICHIADIPKSTKSRV